MSQGSRRGDSSSYSISPPAALRQCNTTRQGSTISRLAARPRNIAVGFYSAPSHVPGGPTGLHCQPEGSRALLVRSGPGTCISRCRTGSLTSKVRYTPLGEVGDALRRRDALQIARLSDQQADQGARCQTAFLPWPKRGWVLAFWM